MRFNHQNIFEWKVKTKDLLVNGDDMVNDKVPASSSSDGTQSTWPWPCGLWRHTCCHTARSGCFHRRARDPDASWERSCMWCVQLHRTWWQHTDLTSTSQSCGLDWTCWLNRLHWPPNIICATATTVQLCVDIMLKLRSIDSNKFIHKPKSQWN